MRNFVHRQRKFTYLFLPASPPKIKCTNYKLLHGDTVITSDDTLVFTFQVIDSSGQGLASVDLSGEMPQTADSVTFYQTIIGMNQYSNLNPKVETIKATNKIGPATNCYVLPVLRGIGPAWRSCQVRLVNPPGPTLTTRLDTLLYVLYIDNYSQDTVNVSTLATGKTLSRSHSRIPFTNSSGLCLSTLGYNTIKTQASIPGKGRCIPLKQTLVIQRRPLALRYDAA